MTEIRREKGFWGKLLKVIRKEKKISQRGLALKSGVSRSTIKRIENGSSNGDIETMETLFNTMGLELELLDPSGPGRG